MSPKLFTVKTSLIIFKMSCHNTIDKGKEDIVQCLIAGSPVMDVILIRVSYIHGSTGGFAVGVFV